MGVESTDRGRFADTASPSGNGFTPVIRRYQPHASAMAELVEVLLRLLLEVTSDQSEAARQRPDPTCFSGRPE